MRTAATPAPLRKSPKDEARVFAYLNARSLAALDRCKDGWCRIRVDGVTGWAPASDLWGADERPQCR